VAILFKNLIDVTTGTVVWYFVGFAFAFGADHGNMIGTTHFFLADCDDYYCYLIFLFEWAFAGACATILSVNTFIEKIKRVPLLKGCQ
jgi:Amt family ammonium transporter